MQWFAKVPGVEDTTLSAFVPYRMQGATLPRRPTQTEIVSHFVLVSLNSFQLLPILIPFLYENLSP